MFVPAWLAYGHSFAVKIEHDQAMSAFFKVSQSLAPALVQPHSSSARLSMILHELGVTAFISGHYKRAEK